MIDLASGAGDSVEPGGLAGQICEDEGQQITQSALRGLLVTIADIGPEGLVELSAPTMEGVAGGRRGRRDHRRAAMGHHAQGHA